MDVRRILIMGDHMAVQALLEDGIELHSNDKQVVFTTDSRTALGELRDLSFDLILVADETPNLNGLPPSQAAREIWPDAPIVRMGGSLQFRAARDPLDSRAVQEQLRTLEPEGQAQKPTDLEQTQSVL